MGIWTYGVARLDTSLVIYNDVVRKLVGSQESFGSVRDNRHGERTYHIDTTVPGHGNHRVHGAQINTCMMVNWLHGHKGRPPDGGRGQRRRAWLAGASTYRRHS